MPRAASSSQRTNPSRRTMKAAAIERFGAPAVLKVHELPVPQPAPNEVLIALHASGVGVWDADIRKGWWPRGRPKFPLVLGTDGAGLVAAKGARVRRFEMGERVWAYEFINPKGGFYAEYVAVRAENVARVPQRLDLLQAGAATVTALTALQGVDDVLGLRRGESALIFGATGAVGTLAVQFAKRLGARVIATGTGRKATRLVLGLGAAASFDARAGDAVERLRALAPEGLDAVLAFAGGPVLDRCLDLMKAEGRVAYPSGVEPEPKRRRRRFSVLSYDADASTRLFTRLERAVDEARLQVPVAAVYPLAQAARAHERLERGGVLGRIVLRIALGPREGV
jgi:NADPH2:quinone reductase